MTTGQNGLQSISIPATRCFSDHLASLLLQQHADQLPNLGNVHIILPNAQAVRQFRISLSRNARGALLAGYSGSLKQWLTENIPLQGNERQIISPSARQLLLIEALKQHPDLFDEENHWQICDSLLELFDELSLSPHQWLDESTPAWVEQLQRAYQLDRPLHHLNQEARIIQTLWQAWQQQLSEMQLSDESGALKKRLLQPLPAHIQNQHFYIVGFEQLSPLEKAWCEQLQSGNTVYHVQQGLLPGESASEGADEAVMFFSDVFDHSPPLFQRCQQYQQAPSENHLQHIHLYDAQSAEQETHAVELKVRQALLAGKNNIAVVTENRKLARRLRALLERADVNIQDTAGWALATTSAASLMERWLECIEQDFSHLPLLDLLKSPFFCDASTRTEHLQSVYRFEQDIVLHENIANDLQRYKQAIAYRSKRLNLQSETTATQLTQLIERLQEAAAELLALHLAGNPISPEKWMSVFLDSLKKLGVYPQLAQDIAGMRVQQELEKLQQAHQAASPLMSWQDFRTWLGGSLEREQFKPHEQTSVVKVMNMQQAQYCQFDSLIIAGANAQSFPGKASQLPFFNQAVRQALALKNWQQQKDYQLYQFRQLLFAADEILITWQAEKNGEWLAPSPWVSSLQDFSQLALQHDMKDHELDYLIQHTQPLSHRDESLTSAIETVYRAEPRIHAELVPTTFSASRHQRLIDCPYKFFAADVLRLKPLEQISTELMKSEYGEKVHLILQAFHQQVEGLPAPFKGMISRDNRQQALQHLEELSKRVFRSQAEDSIQHRGWIERWLKTAPAYIDWQIERNQKWKIHQLEQQAESALQDGIILAGRLDRIDSHNDTLSIVDYKTGGVASQQEIELAENVQLINYATLLENVQQVLYLKLDNGEAKEKGSLEGDILESLTQDTLQRLQRVIEQIRSSMPLISWGDKNTCNYCEMQGLCRKQLWQAADHG